MRPLRSLLLQMKKLSRGIKKNSQSMKMKTKMKTKIMNKLVATWIAIRHKDKLLMIKMTSFLQTYSPMLQI